MFEVYDLKILFDIVMVRLVAIKVLDLSTGMLTYNKAAGVISPYSCYSNVFEPLILKSAKRVSRICTITYIRVKAFYI